MDNTKKLLIGLDMSITSTGLCIEYLNQKILYIFHDKKLTNNAKVDGVKYIKYNRILPKDNLNLDDNMVKLKSYNNLAYNIYIVIKELVDYFEIDFTKDVFVYFEKPSLQSKGSSKLEIPIVNALIRNELFKHIPIENFKGFEPSKLKKSWCGKGNAKKEDMEKEYHSRQNLPPLIKKQKTSKIDDLVDAVALIEINK